MNSHMFALTIAASLPGLSAASAAGQACGGLPLVGCGNVEFRDKGQALCRLVTSKGMCVHKPIGCLRMNLKPVCGCNAQTYQNACLAAQAGQTVVHQGRCS